MTLSENETSLEVKLEPTPAAWGKVVDKISGEPIEGVFIHAKNSWMGSFYSGAISREDGSFLIEYLPRRNTRAVFKKHDYNQHTSNILFLHEDESRLVIELDDVPMMKVYAYGKPEKPPSIEGLSGEENLKAMVDYLNTELAKLPKEEDSQNGFGASNSSDHMFRKLLVDNIGSHASRLFDEKNDEQLKIRAAIALFDTLLQPKVGSHIPNNSDTCKLAAANHDQKF